jgi:hypothetical protein
MHVQHRQDLSPRPPPASHVLTLSEFFTSQKKTRTIKGSRLEMTAVTRLGDRVLFDVLTSR